MDRFKVAENLRKEGKSYSEISKELDIAKSTLSSWFSKKRWSGAIREKLNSKLSQKNVVRIALMNKAKRLEKLKRDSGFRDEAVNEYEKMKNIPLFIAGLSIYWGEGDKRRAGIVSVINTDENLLKVIVNFYKEILKIPLSKIRAGIFIYRDIDAGSALEHWASEINVPKGQFVKTQLLPSRSKITKRRITMGMCSVYFCSTKVKIKLIEWMKLLALDMRR